MRTVVGGLEKVGMFSYLLRYTKGVKVRNK
jgi:hypothetical protein